MDLSRLLRPTVGGRRRGHRPSRQLRRPGADQPRRDRLSGRGVGRQPRAHLGVRPRVRADAGRPARGGRRGDRRDPGRRRARGDRAGRRARVRRRGRVQRRLRRDRRVARSSSARWWTRRSVTGSRCAGRTATGSSRCTRAAALWGDALAPREARRGRLDLAERQRRGQRARGAARSAIPHRDRQRQPVGADGGRLSGVAGAPGRRAVGGAVPGGRRRPAAVRRARGVRRGRRARGGAKVGSSPAGRAGGGGAQRRAGRRPARVPRAARGGRRGLGRGSARAARAREGAGGRRRGREAERRAGDPDLLGRRLGPGRRRGDPPWPRAAAVRAADLRAPAGAAAARGDGREPARLHGDDLGRCRRARRARGHGRGRSGDRRGARVLRPAGGSRRRVGGIVARGPRGVDRGRRSYRRAGARVLDAARAARRRGRVAIRVARDRAGRRAADRDVLCADALRREPGDGARLRAIAAAARAVASGVEPAPTGSPSTSPRRCCAPAASPCPTVACSRARTMRSPRWLRSARRSH